MNNQPVYRKNQIQTLILLLKVLELKSLEDNFSEIFLFLARYSFLFENTENSLNSCTLEPSQIYTEQAFSDWSMKYTDPTGLYDEETGYSEKEISDFKNMNTSEQLKYLKDQVSSVEPGTPSAGKKSAYMRTQLKNSMNLEGLFHTKDGDEKFMNENLRDFLNMKEDGSDYTLSDMNKSGWKRLYWPADSEHQHEKNGGRNKKYVNEDGREAVFDAKGNIIKDSIDAGTFNYGKPKWYPASDHGRYDMKPFFRQNKMQPIYWRLRVGSNYGWNSK